MPSEHQAEREAARRRLMFVPGEDFYFLVYTTLVVLSELKCTTPERAFADTRKLIYLADLLGSDVDLRLALASAPLSQSGRSRLALLYDRAAARHAPLERINDALSRRGLVIFTRASGAPDEAFLADQNGVRSLVRNSIFDAERERLDRLRSSLKQLRIMSLPALKERLFGRHGVHTWGD